MKTLRRARDELLIVDPGLAGARAALFGLLGGVGGVLLGMLAGGATGSSVSPTELVLPGVVGAVGSTTLSAAPVSQPWRTALVVGGAAGLAALVVAVLPPTLGRAPVFQVALLSLVTAGAAWSRTRGPVPGAAGLAVWLGTAVTLAGGTGSRNLVSTALGPLLVGCWLALLASTLLRTRPEVGLRLAVVGLLAAAEDRSIGPRNRARVRLLRLALTADAQLQRCVRSDAPALRLALIALHAAADDAVTSGGTAAAQAVRARADEVRTLLRPGRPVPTGAAAALLPGAVLTQGILPGSKPAEAATAPDPRGTHSLPSAATRQILRVGAAGLLAGVAGSLLAPGHLVWAVLTVFTVLSGPSAAATSLARALGRVAGTAAGVGIGLVVDHLLSAQPVLLVVVAVAGVALGFSIQSRHYAVAMAAGSVAIAALYRLLGPDAGPMLALRLSETAVGGVSAIVVTLALWPVSAEAVRRTVDRDVSARRRELHAVLDEAVPDRLAAAVLRQEQAVDAWLSAGPRRRPSDRETAALLDHIAVPRRYLRPSGDPS